MGRPGTFKPGQSGNPGGRPKLIDELRQRALKSVDEHCITAWIHEVIERGDNWVKCSELLAAYGMGKPVQPMEHAGADGESLSVEVRLVKPNG